MMTHSLEGCKGYITSQSTRSLHPHPEQLPAIAISRETGTGARNIARAVARHLNDANPHAACEWTTFDKKLVETVLEDHGLAEKIQQFMPEDSVSDLKDAVEEMLGIHPSQWKLVHYTTDTIRRLAAAGNSIIVGRGATEITARMDHVLRVRLVAPLGKRIARIAETQNLSREAAEDFIRKTDRARSRYVSRNFLAKSDDPLRYHLTLNLGLITDDEAARLIAESLQLLKPMPKE